MASTWKLQGGEREASSYCKAKERQQQKTKLDDVLMWLVIRTGFPTNSKRYQYTGEIQIEIRR
jgi:hypothetical protein